MFSWLASWVRVLYRVSVWHPDSVDPEEFKYRHLKRVWLPLFDAVSIAIGVLGVAHGSRLLNELYQPALVDTVGTVYIIASGLALLGVAFPRLFAIEILGKLVMLTTLGTYSALVWTSYFSGAATAGFVAAILMLSLVLPLFRLQMLGEEIKERRVA